MSNASNFYCALFWQVKGNTKNALACMELVEPMQTADAAELLELVNWSADKENILDLLVNSAIVGMTDNRAPEVDKDSLVFNFLRDILAQRPELN